MILNGRKRAKRNPEGRERLPKGIVPSKAWERGLRCKKHLETFRRDPAGNQARPGERNQHLEASLCVVVGRPTLRSVGSQLQGQAIELRKVFHAGALVVPLAGATPLRRHGNGGMRSCRSRRTWHRSTRGLPGTWEFLSVSTGIIRPWGGRTQTLPVHRRCVLGRWERTRRRTVWYRQAKETKCGERDGRRS